MSFVLRYPTEDARRVAPIRAIAKEEGGQSFPRGVSAETNLTSRRIAHAAAAANAAAAREITDDLDALIVTENMWSPGLAAVAGSAPTTPMLLADGGCVENLGIMPLLQRRMASIVLFDSTSSPLANRSAWDPYARAPASGDIDGCAFFVLRFA